MPRKTKDELLQQAVRGTLSGHGKRQQTPTANELRMEAAIDDRLFRKEHYKWRKQICATQGCTTKFVGPGWLEHCKNCRFDHNRAKYEKKKADRDEIQQAILALHRRKLEMKGKK